MTHPSDEESGQIRADLNTSAHLAYLRGTLEHGHPVACLSHAERGRQTAQSTADDEDVQGQLGFAPAIKPARLVVI
jgi:hypothetical protein